MNIFEALRESHDKQRTLVDLLVKTHGDSEGREELFERLRTEMEHHANAEERHFYVPLMEHDLTQEKARHSVAEHKELDDYIEKLEATGYDSSGWLAHAKTLQHRLMHHLEEEEHEVFQMAGKVLTEKEKTSLAADYMAHMQEQAEE